MKLFAAVFLLIATCLPLAAVTTDNAPDQFAASPSKCAGLKNLTIANTEITSAIDVAAGSFKVPPQEKVSYPISLPAFCRVQGILRPTKDSSIRFEVWMPISGWNGRFEQIGNGGFAGKFFYRFMTPELPRGFAIAATDDGHIDGSDQSWAIGHPEKVIDFGYRAVHTTSESAKTIVAAFYGQAPVYSYFNGCSDGGREALMEAQRFPQDFNGIIAGAPANFWTHLMVGVVWTEQALLNKPADYIPASKLPAIQAAALAACDGLDGVKDGLVEDPRICHFNPTVLLCKGADNPNCLTAAQVETARKIYSGPRNPRTGKQIFPGYAPGAEAAITDWPQDIIGSWPNGGWDFLLVSMFYSDMVFEKPAWNFRTFNFDSDVALTDAKISSILNATNPDLRQFKSHGGKLIQYHGWADAVIAPLNSVNYYQSVVREMGGLKKTRISTVYIWYPACHTVLTARDL